MKVFWRRNTAQESKLQHVDGLIDWLLVIGMVSLAAIVLLGALLTSAWTTFGNFVLWSLLAALASLLVGSALGVLFGLPTVRRVEITQGRPAHTEDEGSPPNGDSTPARVPQRQDQDQLGYAESTNLEQVADWLTKIIVGLTLTQYASWEGRFAQLSYDLTYRLLGGAGCDKGCLTGAYPPGTTIPGGALLIFFTALGFMVAYLWMRGYFITEMVTAKRIALVAAQAEADRKRRVSEIEIALAEAEAKRAVSEAARLQAEADRTVAEEARRSSEAELEKARSQGLLQERDKVSFTPEKAGEFTSQVTFVAEEAQEAAAEIRESIAAGTDSDDPWKGQFGGEFERDKLRLSATVTPTAMDAAYFDVVLTIAGLDDATCQAITGKSARVFLHPTFGDEPRTVYFNADGTAQLKLIAYGAFTVGVLVETGTKLELNLATIEGAPQDFLSR